MTLGTHAVKVKAPGDKVWYFLTPSGGTTRLTLHAGLTDQDKAEACAARIRENHPGVQAKAVAMWKGSKT